MFFCDCASRSNTALDSVSSPLRYCMTAPRANLEIVRLVARIRQLSSQKLCKNKIFGKVSETRIDYKETYAPLARLELIRTRTRKRIRNASTCILKLASGANEHENYSAGQNIYAFIKTIKRLIKAH